jgi:hypothetical protein
LPAAADVHELHTQHGSPSDGFKQLTNFARILAALVFPQPLGPEKRYACPSLPARKDERSKSVAALCSIISEKNCGRNLR